MRERFRKASRWLSVMVVTAMMCLPTQSFGALAVASRDIVPADGTTGQDVTTGNGVKTGHIQNGAIITSKIIDAAITTPKIADGAVTTTKIGASAIVSGNIADGAITTAKISTLAVTADNISDGAVIDSKISGTISTSKLNIGTTAGTVAAGDHNHDVMYQKKPEKILIVAKSGGDYSSLSAALSAAAALAPYVTVKVMPGVYENESAIDLYGKTNISIIGESNDSVVVKNFFLHIMDSSNITISGISFENGDNDILQIDSLSTTTTDITITSSVFKGGNPYGSFGAIAIGPLGSLGCNNIVFKNNVVEAPVYYAITFSGNTAAFDSNVIKGGELFLSFIANEVEVTNNNFITGSINPMDYSLNSILSNSSRNIRITGNRMKGAPNAGINLQYSNNIYIANNDISSCGTGFVATSSSGFIDHNRVLGNTYDVNIEGGSMKVFYNIFDTVTNTGGVYRYNVDSNGNDRP